MTHRQKLVWHNIILITRPKYQVHDFDLRFGWGQVVEWSDQSMENERICLNMTSVFSTFVLVSLGNIGLVAVKEVTEYEVDQTQRGGGARVWDPGWSDFKGLPLEEQGMGHRLYVCAKGVSTVYMNEPGI